ncbi:hypothetical protein ACHQM5_009398 [Ranunculus cassubicifolius]
MSYIVCQGKTLWPEFLGVDGEVAAAAIERENPRLRTVILHQRRGVRIRDYNCFRVRIWVNDNGIVVRVPQIA